MYYSVFSYCKAEHAFHFVVIGYKIVSQKGFSFLLTLK